MTKTQLATRIETKIKRAVEKHCKERGLKITRFVEEALLDKMEELQDVEDLKKIRREPTRPFEEVLRELNEDA